MDPQVQVGVGCLLRHVFDDGVKFLVAQRKGSHGDGHWQLAGGHLEFGESFEECAARETLEETNLDLKGWTYVTTTNDVMVADKKHYVTIFMLAEVENVNQVKTMEPHKIQGGWQWKSWDEICRLDGLFLPLSHLTSLLDMNAFVPSPPL
ncbi:hypothetical protein DM01DRAFT_1321560 [Hesseltinella vesiculosa]|uniref:Nudix hydrolase domain-containing protein n=1 Tax=Hesseltinella vesiculosa TaxID=101127 RepID=A0A1X2GJM5_9FUNG|nr:hypothetical protein DM01DRAFT_1321560 [Hesseltinella vesiculosa]